MNFPLLPLLNEISACTLCTGKLPYAPRPVLAAHASARLLIVGQAPGRRVQESGIPWSDASGQQLRRWLDMPPEVFYDGEQVAILPIGFCYPGTGRNGDLPPRPECAPAWHARLLAAMPNIRLTLLIGAYAQQYYLGPRAHATLTQTVADWKDYLPAYFPLPHPSPRNRLWLSRNPWFEAEVIPVLREHVRAALQISGKP
jgi:uracil-DNA glycosylase